jgi:glycosyltransferase involved in cell wall biosynthesis
MKSLTVIIPTNGNYETLGFTLINSVALKSVLEIIVLDSCLNGPPEKIQELILNQKKIKYIKTNSKFNAVQNFNEGVSYITSDYCVYIGDDDILTSTVDEIMENWKDTSVEGVVPTYPVSYQWPGYRTNNQGNMLSATIVSRSYNGSIDLVDNPRNQLKKAIGKSHLGPQNLPRLYLGIIKSSIIRHINEKYSGIFGGVSPDIYSSTLLAWELKKYVVIDYPLIVPGASPKSTTALAAEKKHTGRFSDSKHMQAFENLKWPHNIPEIYSTQTVWSYSMQAALEKINKGHSINYKSLYLSFELSDTEFLKIIFNCTLINTKRLDLAIESVVMAIIRSMIGKIKYLLSKNHFIKYRLRKNVKHNVMNSIDAKKIIENESLTPLDIIKLLRGI